MTNRQNSDGAGVIFRFGKVLLGSVLLRSDSYTNKCYWGMSNAYYPMKLIDFCMKYDNILCCLSTFCVLCPLLPVSLYFPFFIVPSNFSNVYLHFLTKCLSNAVKTSNNLVALVCINMTAESFTIVLLMADPCSWLVSRVVLMV
jgi:hypothetical protein